jgi:hypothetical protein
MFILGVLFTALSLSSFLFCGIRAIDVGDLSKRITIGEILDLLKVDLVSQINVIIPVRTSLPLL